MRSGTEKNPNPHNPSLGAFLRARAVPVNRGYVTLGNGQILREDTFDAHIKAKAPHPGPGDSRG